MTGRALLSLLLSLSLLLGSIGPIQAFKVQPRQETKSGYPSPKGAGISGEEYDESFFAVGAGVLSRGSTQTLGAAGQIDCRSDGIIPVVGSGGAVTLTSNPQLLAPTDLPNKKWCVIEGTSDTNTLTIVDGNGVDLRYASSVTLGLQDMLILIYNGSVWIGSSARGIPNGTAFPPTPGDYDAFIITDDSASGACDSGAGSAVTLCYWDPVGEGWEPLGGSGGGGAGTLDQAFDGGKAIDGANSHANAMRIGNGTWYWDHYVDGTNAGFRRFCNAAQSTCVTPGLKAETGSDFGFTNENGTSCWTFDSVTGAYAFTNSGTCVNNVVTTDGTQTLTNKVILHPANLQTAATYTMLTTDCGGTIVNNDADAIEVDLIADPGGCTVCFFDRSGGAMTLDPNGSDQIIVSALSPANGDSITLASGIGNNVCLVGGGPSLWLAFPGQGALSDTN